MATSSITKNFIVEGVEQAEIFANAIEDSLKHPSSPSNVRAIRIEGHDQLMKILSKRKDTDAI